MSVKAERQRHVLRVIDYAYRVSAAYFGEDPQEVAGRSKLSRVVVARHVAWIAAKRFSGVAWHELAKLMGYDHSAVMYAQRKRSKLKAVDVVVEKLMDADWANLKWEDQFDTTISATPRSVFDSMRAIADYRVYDIDPGERERAQVNVKWRGHQGVFFFESKYDGRAFDWTLINEETVVL